MGNGLYLKKVSGTCWIKTDGERLYLGPTSGRWFETVGNGLTWWNKVGGMTVED